MLQTVSLTALDCPIFHVESGKFMQNILLGSLSANLSQNQLYPIMQKEKSKRSKWDLVSLASTRMCIYDNLFSHTRLTHQIGPSQNIFFMISESNLIFLHHSLFFELSYFSYHSIANLRVYLKSFLNILRRFYWLWY